jgi:hypothetical protein
VTSSAESPPAEPAKPSAATPEDDALLLGPWQRAFEALWGKPVQAAPFDPADPRCGRRLTFPRLGEIIDLMGSTGHFRRNPAMVEHIRRFGFEWDDDGRVMIVPTPGTFNARLSAIGIPRAGFRLAYARGTTHSMALGPWLLRYMDGTITLLVNTPGYYDWLIDNPAEHNSRADPRWGLLSVGHDLSVHALNYHLIPHTAVADLATRIRAALPERAAAWPESSLAPLTLTYFYDNDLNRYAYAVWCRCDRPESFASIFLAPRNYDQLVAALEVRLAETKSGLGDVPTGDSDDMEKLAETEFRVA